MKFRFWGVRGSLPCPLSPTALKAKVSAILQNARPRDLSSPEAKERFLASLPSTLFGHVGGNTTCLQVETDDSQVLVVDGGTGIRELGQWLASSGNPAKHFHIFLTHLHWDHIQGLPFFSAFFSPDSTVTLYSPLQGFEEFIHSQMAEPHFPVRLSSVPARINFVVLKDEVTVVGSTAVRWKSVNHPGDCIAYRFDRLGKSLVFSTDTELRMEDFQKTPENVAFFEGVDVLILDAQYTLGEALDRMDWGHTSSSHAVDFALNFFIRRLYLFHHEPNHDDNQIEEIGRVAQWYAEHKSLSRLDVRIAREGQNEEVP